MAKKQKTERSARVDLVKVCAFIALTVAALLYVVGAVLNWLHLGQVTSVLNLLAQLSLLVAIGIPAWGFVRGKTRGWKVIYWVALFIYVFGVVFGVIGVFVIK